jgi:hypothetical protein
MGFFGFLDRRILFGLALIGAAGAFQTAFAQSTPTAINEAQGAMSGLGTSHRFATHPAAAAHCPGDTVVWSASPDLLYDLPASPDFGKGGGFYACKAEADDAGFHAESN